MTTTIYYTATSLDGFLADPNDSLTWLFAQEHSEPDESALQYDTLIGRTGALVMGASTYLWIHDRLTSDTLAANPAEAGKDCTTRNGDSEQGWPYQQPTFVFTHRELPRIVGADLRFASGDVADFHPRIAESTQGKDIWLVGGGDLVGQYADAGLLDEIIVAIAPVTLGAGKPLLPRRMQLRTEQIVPANNFVWARYTPAGIRPGADWTA